MAGVGNDLFPVGPARRRVAVQHGPGLADHRLRRFSTSGVRTYAGQTVLEVTPRGPPSRASVLDSPSVACLAATYALLYGDARSPCTEEMCTSRPHPRSYIPGSTRRSSRNGASTIRVRIW